MRRRRTFWLGAGALGIVLSVVVADRLLPPDLSRFDDRSVSVVAAGGELLRAFPATGGFWRLKAEPADVDPLYLRMLIAYEDKRFERHIGVDPAAIGRAAWQALANRRVISGASTLTMQAARLLEPRPRSLAAKFIQMARAAQLERRLTKDQILSVYLTLAPFGGNLEGVRAASLAYFGKEPRRLTAGQAALLVALPKWPERARPDRSPKRARRARDAVLARMQKLGVLTKAQTDEAREEAVPTARRDLPFHAPHLARRLRGSAGDQVTTTIDLEFQRSIERIAARWRARIPARASLAILVRRNPTAATVAYVGSADFFADRRAGQVDMVRAVRSPGSTLKPFIYALAFDDDAAHPETLVEDAPTRFADYVPENFTRGYDGEVTIREALQRSLNIPAVAVLDRIGPRRFAARLARAGVSLKLPDMIGDSGLPVALGGVGLTLEDLVGLYASLANQGVFLDGRLGAVGSARKPTSLFRPASAWQIARILEGVPRPGVTGPVRQGRRAVAWKTGTSYGFRDAWAVGFDSDYTVGVWVGRADGTPVPGSIGRTAAGPLLFAVFDSLPMVTQSLAERRPPVSSAVMSATPPAHLRRLKRRNDIAGARRAPPPRIVFPPNGAEIEIERRDDTVVLKGAGGAAPLRWLVDGRLIGTPGRRRTVTWRPDGAGFSRITLIDATGRSASARVRLR